MADTILLTGRGVDGLPKTVEVMVDGGRVIAGEGPIVRGLEAALLSVDYDVGTIYKATDTKNEYEKIAAGQTLAAWNKTRTAGADNVYVASEGAGERNPGTANQYGVGVDECDYHVLDKADGTDVQVSSGSPALLFSVYVNEALAGATIILQDDTTAVITLPAGLAAGTLLKFPGLKFDTDLTANAEAGLTTGNITIGWRLQ